MPLVLLGAGILWFGWFGFNAGSAESAGKVAGYALVNTQLGACAAMLAWMSIAWWRRGKPSGLGIASGSVAGLAAITPASGYVQPWAAIIIGAAAGLLCYAAVHLKDVFHYDDSLGVVGVHMVGGVIGVLLTGVFASLNATCERLVGTLEAVPVHGLDRDDGEGVDLPGLPGALGLGAGRSGALGPPRGPARRWPRSELRAARRG